ncbi:RNA-binding protein spenito [Caerostris extrusa]|uniref:RNA-binding protein spenito n=1 Tax=Caerostris extrusa TaxID=172846 RepID=A0AAV4XNH2_CAEEX|nr:RNA-binding protein spenito [Caerostris extrusa]
MLPSCLAWWIGTKNSAFPARMHVCSGDSSLVDYMMKDHDSDSSMLRITQRLRLDPPKLEDVSRRISTAGALGHCLLLTFPDPIHPGEDQDASVQSRPLRNLVSYLKQKRGSWCDIIALVMIKEMERATWCHVCFPTLFICTGFIKTCCS